MESYKEESTRSSPETFSSIQRSLLSRIAIISKQSILIKDASLKGSTISQIYLEDCIKLAPTSNNPKIQDKNWNNLNDPQFEILRWSTSPYLGVQTYQKDEKICCVLRDYLRSPIDSNNSKNNNRYIFFLSSSPWSHENSVYLAIRDLPIEDKYSNDVGNITDVAWGPYYQDLGKQLLFIACGKLILCFIVNESISDNNKIECKYINSFKPYDDNISSMELKYDFNTDFLTFITSYSKGQILNWNLKWNISDANTLEMDPSIKNIYPSDSRCVSLMRLGKNDILIAAKGSIIAIVSTNYNFNTLYVAHEGMITGIDWVNMDEMVFATVGTDSYFRIWKVLQSSDNKFDIQLLYQCENSNGSIWGISISPNKSFYYLLSKKEGQYKMYHQKIDSGLISFQRLGYFVLNHIIENLLREETPTYWDILALLSCTPLITLNNTIDDLILQHKKDLKLKRVLFILLRYKMVSWNSNDEQLKQEIESLRNEIKEECIIMMVNKFLSLEKYNPNDEEITSLNHLYQYLVSNGSEKSMSIASNLNSRLKSYNIKSKPQLCTYCQSTVSYNDSQCPLSHDLDWCPSTNLLLVNLNNKACYNCDLLYKDLQQTEGFEWIPKHPQICITCGEILRSIN